jgi:hypothetical protein
MKLSRLFLMVFLLPYSVFLGAEPVCSDRDAISAGNDKALSYFGKQGEIFHVARVLKVHHPSRHKEVASYVKVKAKRYSIFTLVDVDCNARFIKRTRQND